MSDKERRRKDGGNGGADEEDSDGPTEIGDPKEKKWKRCWRKGKRVSLLFRRRKKQKGVYVNPGCWWQRRRRRRGGGGHCCLKGPVSVGSSCESPRSDPNSPAFTFDMLRSLIEKNDFYSKECNPHLDGDD